MADHFEHRFSGSGPLGGTRHTLPAFRLWFERLMRLNQNRLDIDLGLAMAGSFWATLPLLVLFVFVGRRMVAGIMEGAFKG